MKIIGDRIFARDADGRPLSRIGTIFFRTPGLVTKKGVHAMQRLMWIEEINAERAKAGQPAMTMSEEDAEMAESVDLIFTEDQVLIRPNPDRMDLAFRADAELQKLLDRYALTVHRFHRSETNSLPFFEFTPKDCPVDEVPLVVYVPGSGEQGTNLCVQFNQRVCLEKVVSSEFQKKHPCRFLLVCLPDGANVGVAHGYPDARNEWSDLYHDLIFAYARQAEGPKVDLRRVYLTALGSGARIAGGLALDHPGRYAASALAWYYPNVTTVHPQYPGSWRIYNVGSACGSKSFAENVLAAGGDCTFHGVSPEAAHPWWNAVWSGDEVWDWLFDKMSTFSR